MVGLLALRGTIITPKEEITDGVLTIDAGKIVHVEKWRVGPYRNLLDFSGNYISPGLIDIHVHGGGGYNTTSLEGLEGLSEFLARNGVTSFLPTTHTALQEEIVEAVSIIKKGMRRGVNGAVPLGIHMEGPFISPRMFGAQNPDYIRSPDLNEISEIHSSSGENLRIVTLAPEVEGCLDIISWLKSKEVVPAAGHTDATHDEMMKAIDAGLSHASHLFNRMRGFHHREPGTVGAALMNDKVTVELVADNYHLHPTSLEMTYLLKGPEKIALVSDAIPPAGLPEGEYDFGKQKITISGGRSLLDSGSFAGSTITLNDAVKNMLHIPKVSIQKVIEMAQEKMIDAVVVYKLDRMFRSTVDALETTRQFDKWNVSFHYISLPYRPTKTSFFILLPIPRISAT